MSQDITQASVEFIATAIELVNKSSKPVSICKADDGSLYTMFSDVVPRETMPVIEIKPLNQFAVKGG